MSPLEDGPLTHLSVSPRMEPLRWWLLWLVLALGVQTQKLPTRDEGLFQIQIRDKALFHDSSVIPDGAEISSYLFRDTPKRYAPSSPSLISNPVRDAPLSERKVPSQQEKMGVPLPSLTRGLCFLLTRTFWVEKGNFYISCILECPLPFLQDGGKSLRRTLSRIKMKFIKYT